jgi:hypothetical protein
MVTSTGLVPGHPTYFRPQACPSQRDAAASAPLCDHLPTSQRTGDRWAPSRPSGRGSTTRRSGWADATPLSGYAAAHRRARPHPPTLSRRTCRLKNSRTAFLPDFPPSQVATLVYADLITFEKRSPTPGVNRQQTFTIFRKNMANYK